MTRAQPSFADACAELARLQRREWARLLREAVKLRLVQGALPSRYALLDSPPLGVEALRECVREQAERTHPPELAVGDPAHGLLSACIERVPCASPNAWPSVEALASAALSAEDCEAARLRWAWALCETGRAAGALEWLDRCRARRSSPEVGRGQRVAEAIAWAQAGCEQRAISRTAWLCGQTELLTPFWVWALHLTHAADCRRLGERVAARADHAWLHAPSWRPYFERCARAVGPWAPVADDRAFASPSTRWRAHWQAARSA